MTEPLHADTNCVIRAVVDHGITLCHYAACTATGCTWVGPARRTPGQAKADARRHAYTSGA